MAIIAGQVPPAQELPVDFKRRVVIKFRPGTQLPYSAAAADDIRLGNAAVIDRLDVFVEECHLMLIGRQRGQERQASRRSQARDSHAKLCVVLRHRMSQRRRA